MDEQKKPDISLEDLIERERNALGASQVWATILIYDVESSKANGSNLAFAMPFIDKSNIGVLFGMEKT